MGEYLSLGGLFLSAVGSATLLPGTSEAVLAGLLYQGLVPVTLLWIVASLGNSAGCIINWWVGGQLDHFKDRRWFPIKEDQLAKASNWFERYGKLSLLLAWVPVVGDALTVVAGLFRMHLVPFFVLVFIGKAARYAVFIWLTIQALEAAAT